MADSSSLVRDIIWVEYAKLVFGIKFALSRKEKGPRTTCRMNSIREHFLIQYYSWISLGPRYQPDRVLKLYHIAIKHAIDFFWTSRSPTIMTT